MLQPECLEWSLLFCSSLPPSPWGVDSLGFFSQGFLLSPEFSSPKLATSLEPGFFTPLLQTQVSALTTVYAENTLPLGKTTGHIPLVHSVLCSNVLWERNYSIFLWKTARAFSLLCLPGSFLHSTFYYVSHLFVFYSPTCISGPEDKFHESRNFCCCCLLP